MKALSLTQPWATLMALGGHPEVTVQAIAKSIETRSWSTAYRGPLAIHASKKWNDDVVRWVMSSDEARTIRWALRDGGYDKLAELPLGSILCIGNLVDCLPITKDNAPHPVERSYGDYSTEPKQRYAWHLADVRTLPAPVPARGSHRLWTPAPDLMASLEHFYRQAG